MSHHIRRLAYLMKNDVEGVEKGLDTQIADVARFIATLCEARAATRLPVETGHDAIICATEMFNMHMASRSKLIELHGRLNDVAESVGIPELASGGSDKPGPGSRALVRGQIAPVADPLVAADA